MAIIDSLMYWTSYINTWTVATSDVHGWTSAATYKDVLVQRCHGWQGAAGATDGKELPPGFCPSEMC